jgi:predicted small secreted protein
MPLKGPAKPHHGVGEILMRKFAVLAAAAAALIVAGCNTVAGAGRDLGAAGKAISNTAEDVKK